MSSTDLSNGSVSSQLSYNIKNNSSIFHYNSVSRVNYLIQLLLAISYNHIFLDVVQDLRNLGRDYYNKNPRKFCSTIKLHPINGFDNKEITVYLPSGGSIDNSIEYVKIDNIRTTWLMRVLQKQQLPTCWSNKIIGSTGNCEQISVTPQQAPYILTSNEQVLYYYIKNANFFTRTLQLLVNSFRVYSEQRYQCYTLVFPSDLYMGSKMERTFTVTNDTLKYVYSSYLKNSRYNNPYKLPAPIIDKIPYTLPITTYTQSELTKLINNNTDMLII